MAKRGNSEGSIFKRASDGLYVAAVSLPDGKRRRYYAKTRAEVAAKLRQAQEEVAKGNPLPGGRLTTGQYLVRWLEGARSTIRPNTHVGYESSVRRHLTPHLGAIPLVRLGPQDIAVCYQRLLEGGLSPRTVQLAHAVLHRALKQAERWGLVARNAASLVDAPRVERKEIRALTPEQVGALIEAARQSPQEAMILTAVTSGCRWGELTGVRWQDLDLEAATLSVRQQAQRVAGEWVFVAPKTAKGRRIVTLPPFVIEAIRRHRVRQLEQRLAMGAFWAELDLVFCNETGRPLERGNFARRTLKPLLQSADLPDVSIHSLRHSSATVLLAAGAHPKVVQERLGHATIGVTMDTYSHVMPSLQRETADTLERLFAPSGGALVQKLVQ